MEFTTRRGILSLRLAAAALCGLAALVCSARQAFSQVQFYDVYKNLVYHQTGDAAPAAPNLAFFASRVIYSSAGDLTTVSTMYAGPKSPLSYPILFGSGPFTRSTNLPGYATQAAMDADFPDGS